MAKRHSLPSVARSDARILILGSMPGTLSLQEQQYYAQPRNAFWQIMGQLYGFDQEVPYESRLGILMDRRIALWDVLASCYRPGSMDADIRTGDALANDFSAFFSAHPAVVRVFFNGATAHKFYERLVVPALDGADDRLRYERLPSSSPANAAMRLKEKVRVWRGALSGVS
ncbi:MAG: DNA-deoxyinosine glycosylase [Chromatiales bacterium]|jgi:hypoxanthine-DNA glycosylase|nr:MAG: DNA-deoxyinosine glycosylase [Chromatiales bacterium]